MASDIEAVDYLRVAIGDLAMALKEGPPYGARLDAVSRILGRLDALREATGDTIALRGELGFPERTGNLWLRGIGEHAGKNYSLKGAIQAALPKPRFHDDNYRFLSWGEVEITILRIGPKPEGQSADA